MYTPLSKVSRAIRCFARLSHAAGDGVFIRSSSQVEMRIGYRGQYRNPDIPRQSCSLEIVPRP